MDKQKVIILGAAGRDFHNFNVFFRDNQDYQVVAFTATQIPDITDCKYPVSLAGSLYPQGIPIYDEANLEQIIKGNKIDLAVFSYSDVSHEHVMHIASRANAAGASFVLLGARQTMLKSQKPVIAICAVRTGCGKSQTSRKVVDVLAAKGKKAVAVRHPMPYGDLEKQTVQRFASYEDFTKHACTIEEREEYEPYIEKGLAIYAGVDYEKILRQAEKEAEIIVWDGGNNDLPFFKPDLHIVVVDPHRAGHELRYYPGETNFRLADVIVINKMDTARTEDVQKIEANILQINPKATVIKANSKITVERPDLIKGNKVLVIEDGPTLTHGEMSFGAGVVAAKNLEAAEIVDPRAYAVGSIKETFDKFSHLSNLLPAMGYGEKQIAELEETVNMTPCDAVVIATPIDLGQLIEINKPATRATYVLEEIGSPKIEDVLKDF